MGARRARLQAFFGRSSSVGPALFECFGLVYASLSAVNSVGLPVPVHRLTSLASSPLEVVVRASDESPRMFESDFLDRFSRTPWWSVPTIWLPIASGVFAYGALHHPLALGPTSLLVGLGLLGWTLTEYLLHRTFFHWQPETRWGPRLHFLIHGVHHRWVQDPYRLVMPPAAASVLAVVFGFSFYAALGPRWFFPFFAAYILGYVGYDMIHFATHHSKWRNPVFQKLKRHHLLHHHSPRHKDRKFGVSTTLWDHVFRTY